MKHNTKQTKKETRQAINERLTNWYLITLTWGILGILALYGVYQGYRNPSTLLMMQPLLWVLTGIFFAGTIVLFILGKTSKKQQARLIHYGYFLAVCTLISLWLALYNRLRPILESVLQTILNQPTLTIGSFWNVWIPMTAIGLYLVVTFLYFAIRVTKK